MLHIQSIKKYYSSLEVLNIDELQLPIGIYWLKGANGSGKSTFLKVVSELIPLVWLIFFFLGFAETKWLLPLVALSGCLIVFYTSFRRFENDAEIEKLE